MGTQTHWKKTVDKDWIGAYVLPLNDKGEYLPINAKLIKVVYEEVNVRGVKSYNHVAYFEKNNHFDKPMLFNSKTNLQRLEHITKTPIIENWASLNIIITLQAEWDRAYGGGKDWALRINPKAPIIKLPELLPNTEEWKKVKAALVDGYTIEQIKGKYSINQENEKLLCSK